MTSYSLSTLANIVADFGEINLSKTTSPFSATVAVFCDSRQCGQL